MKTIFLKNLTKVITVCLITLTGTCHAMQKKKASTYVVFGKSGKKLLKAFPESAEEFCTALLTKSRDLVTKNLALFDGSAGTNQCHFISIAIASIHNALKKTEKASLTPEEQRLLALCLLLPTTFGEEKETVRSVFADKLFGENDKFKEIFVDKLTARLGRQTLAKAIFKKTLFFIRQTHKASKQKAGLSAQQTMAAELYAIAQRPKSLTIRSLPCLPKFPGIFAFLDQLKMATTPLLLRMRDSTDVVRHYVVDEKTGMCVEAQGPAQNLACIIIEGSGAKDTITGIPFIDLMKRSAARFMHNHQQYDLDGLITGKGEGIFSTKYPTLFGEYKKSLELAKNTDFHIDHVSPGLFDPTRTSRHIDKKASERFD